MNKGLEERPGLSGIMREVEVYSGWIKVLLFMNNGFFDKDKDRGAFQMKDLKKSSITCPVKLIYEKDKMGSFD